MGWIGCPGTFVRRRNRLRPWRGGCPASARRNSATASWGRVRAVERAFYESLVLAERPLAPDPETAANLLAAALKRRGLDPEGERLRRRLAFAGLPLDFEALRHAACRGAESLSEVDLEAHLPFEVRRDLDRLAPVS